MSLCPMMEGWGEDVDSASTPGLNRPTFNPCLGKDREHTSTKFEPVSKMSEEIKQATSF